MLEFAEPGCVYGGRKVNVNPLVERVISNMAEKNAAWDNWPADGSCTKNPVYLKIYKAACNKLEHPEHLNAELAKMRHLWEEPGAEQCDNVSIDDKEDGSSEKHADTETEQEEQPTPQEE